MEGNTYVIDIDDTISTIIHKGSGIAPYSQAKPITETISKLNKLFDEGHQIILFTARGMRTFDWDVEKIEQYHRPILNKWLKDNQVKYHELVFGKPWGPNVFYVDDRCLTVDTFLNRTSEQHLSDHDQYLLKTY
jgi:capsule biosynthesis phosphatase